MKKQGRGQFSFDVFKAAYDSEPKLQELVKNFDKEVINLKSDSMDDVPNAKQDSGENDKVSQMAKSATDLSKSI